MFSSLSTEQIISMASDMSNSSSAPAMSVWPSLQAMWRGVIFSLSSARTSTDRSHRSLRTMRASPRRQASWSGRSPWLSPMLTSTCGEPRRVSVAGRFPREHATCRGLSPQLSRTFTWHWQWCTRYSMILPLLVALCGNKRGDFPAVAVAEESLLVDVVVVLP